MGFEPVETCRNLSLGSKDTIIVMNLDPLFPSAVAAGAEEYPNIDDLVASVLSVSDNLLTLDATKIAIEAGKAVAANAAMIGAVAAVKGFPLSPELTKTVLLETVPQKFRELNAKAFDIGAEKCRAVKKT
jgi:indolepyruvate ferredoxin oxidoreductase beta subunit